MLNQKCKICGHNKNVYGGLCEKHANSIGLAVYKSTIKDAGKGLFATKHFKKGSYICRYGDKQNVMILKEFKQRVKSGELTDEYMYCDGDLRRNDTKCWDATDPQSTLARYSNDASFNDHKHGNINNAEFTTRYGYPWIVATKNIKKYEEIFTNYGDQYWT